MRASRRGEPLGIIETMDLTEVFQALGRSSFQELVEGISMGRLRTYDVYDSFKIRAHLSKLNRGRLGRAVPRLWDRLRQGDQDLARELAQGILVSNLSFVVEALDFLQIPHDGSGFFDKNSSAAKDLEDGWQAKVFAEFRERYPQPLILLYTNHLAWEFNRSSAMFLPAGRTQG